MKAFALQKPGCIGWVDAPEPQLTDYGAILRPVAVAPCSSDVHTIWGGSPKTPNLILGHESVGQVVKTGPCVKDFRPGDIVAVPAITPDWRALGIQENNSRHAGAPFSGHQLGRTAPGVFAEYYSVPDADTTLAKIPDGITLEQALMCTDVVTTGFTGAEYANISIGDVVCVIGIGPVGLRAVAGARLLGAGRIISVGSREKCVTLAKEYGSTDVIGYRDRDIADQILEMTGGRGADSVIIAGGNDEVFAQAVKMARYGTGTISNVNYFGGPDSLPLSKFHSGRGMGGKTIHMELAKGGRVRIERLLEMVRYKRVDPQKLVTHHLKGLDRIEEAIYLMKDKPGDLVKVMVTMN